MAKKECGERMKSHTLFRVLILTFLFLLFLCPEISSVYGDTTYKTDSKKTVPISAKGAVVMDARNGNILYSFNREEQFNPASCTKILAAVIALEEGDLKDEITVSENAVYNIDYDSSHIALDVGEKITLKDALFGMILTSGNDCSVAVAEKLSGSVDKYADKMNRKAEEIGCTGSHFTNPHGLYDKEHYTTPVDMAMIMRYCIENEDFLEISRTLKYTVPKTNKSDVRELWNNHRMVKNKYMYYEPIVCGKSGYITKSGFNLVSYGKKDGIELIVVVMKEDDPTVACEDTKALMEHYFKNYKNQSLPSSESGITTVKVGKKDIPVTMDEEIYLLMPKGISKSEISYDATLTVTNLPVEKGDELGMIQAVHKDKVLGTIPIYAEKTVSKFSFTKIILTVLSIIVILFLIFLALLYIGNIRRKRRYRSRRSRRRTGSRRIRRRT